MATIPLETAQQWADIIICALGPHCDRIEPCGAIRRRLKSVSKIELLCVPRREFSLFDEGDYSQGFWATVNDWRHDRKKEALTLSCRLGLTSEGKLSYVRHGFRLEIHMCKMQSWGYALAYTTGDEGFLDQVIIERIYARNCKQADYEVSDTTGNTIPFLDEESFFEFLGLDYIPPRKRNSPALGGWCL